MKRYLLIALCVAPFFSFSQDSKGTKFVDDKSILDDKSAEFYRSASEKIEKKDFKSASDDLNKLLDGNSSLNFVRYNLGQIFYELGDYKAAQEQYNLFLVDQPANIDALYNLSVIKNHLGDNDGGLETLTLLIKLNEKDPKNYLNRGLVYYKIDKKEAAIADWQTASDLGSKEAGDMLKQFSK